MSRAHHRGDLTLPSPGVWRLARKGSDPLAPGEFQCVNAILQQCNIFGSAFEDSALCDSKAACVANGQKGFCARCKPATAVCESTLVASSIADNSPVLTTNRLLNCNVDGSGTDTQQVCESEAEACSATTKSRRCSLS